MWAHFGKDVPQCQTLLVPYGKLRGFIWSLVFELGAKGVWNLTPISPFGPKWENAGVLYAALYYKGHFYMFLFGAAWGQRGLEPDPNFPSGPILEKMCPSAKPYWFHMENLVVLSGALFFSLGPKGFGT